jgi:hypothetical protein
MKRKAISKKSSNNKPIQRTREANEAIEQVFRSTHKREMTSEERRQFGLSAAVTGKHAPDSVGRRASKEKT